jgi:hypothetical protein
MGLLFARSSLEPRLDGPHAEILAETVASVSSMTRSDAQVDTGAQIDSSLRALLPEPPPHSSVRTVKVVEGRVFGRTAIKAKQKYLPSTAKEEGYPSASIPAFNASSCPSSVVLDGNCKHANNGLNCLPLRRGCTRPCGAFALKLRGSRVSHGDSCCEIVEMIAMKSALVVNLFWLPCTVG